MKEQSTSKIFSLIQFLFIVLFLLSVTSLVFQVNATDSFKQYVNYQIERQGGLTDEALTNIEVESNTYYDGRYKINTEKSTLGAKAYGEVVKYQITGNFSIINYPILSIPNPSFDIEFDGEAVVTVKNADNENEVEEPPVIVEPPKTFVMTYFNGVGPKGTVGTIVLVDDLYKIKTEKINIELFKDIKHPEPGYLFSGWKSNLNDLVYKGGDTYILDHDTEFVAQWVPQPMSIAYHKNTLDEVSNLAGKAEVSYGEDYTLAMDIPSRQGYTFKGWTLDQEGKTTLLNPGAGLNHVVVDTTLYAQWQIETFKVSYNTNGGTPTTIPDNIKEYGVSLKLSTEPVTLAGHTHTGWNTQADGKGVHHGLGDFYGLNKPLELFAEWSINRWTIVYNSTNGTGGPGKVVKEYNVDHAITSEIPTQEGYNFLNWNTERYGKANGTGSNYAAGEKYSLNADLELFAQWKIKDYTITYHANATGVTAVPAPETKEHFATHKLSPEAPLRTGYKFLGWNTQADGKGTKLDGATIENYLAGENYVGNQDLSLYAQWEIQRFDIRFHKNGGKEDDLESTDQVTNMPKDQIKTWGINLTLAAEKPVRPGFTFVEWNDNPEGTGNKYQPSGNYTENKTVDVYAIWKADTWTVTFDANGGTNAPLSQIKTYAEDLKISADMPKKEGYQFTTWNTQADGKGELIPTGSLYTKNQNVTLYAQWQIMEYTIQYDTKGGTVLSMQTKQHGATLILHDTPERFGHTFMGWQSDVEEVGEEKKVYPAKAEYTFNGKTKFTALWDTPDTTITYNAGSGNFTEGSNPKTIKQNKQWGISATIIDVKPVKQDYYFAEWNTVPQSTDPKTPVEKGETFLPGSLHTESVNLVLYAWYAPKEYDIVYHSNGGDTVVGDPEPRIEKKYADIDINLSSKSPTRISHNFVGWNTKADGTGTKIDGTLAENYLSNELYTKNDHLTLYAQWALKTYSITYGKNTGDTAPEPQAKTYGIDLTLKTELPVKAGHTFTFWNTHPEGTGTTYTPGFVYKANENLSLYAQWKINYYNVTFNSDGGTAVAAQSIAYNSLATVPTPPTKTGYTFSGWSPAITTPITKDTVFTAQWTINKYPVTFNSDGGTVVAAQSVTYNTLATVPTPPIKTGYTFNGWSPAIASTPITKATTFIAQWKINYYNVTFNSDGGTAVAAQSIAYNSLATVPTNPTKTGYTFNGWSPAIAATPITKATTFTAQWTINKYTVTFDSKGGSAVPSQTVTYNTLATVPTPPTKTGYTFSGWSPAIASTPITKATTFIAQWTPIKYPVTFNSNGGSTVAAQSVDYNTLATVPTPPTKTGYTFNGWSPAIAATPITKATTFTAQWTINKYTVTFDSKGGSAVPSQTVTYNTMASVPEDPIRNEYTFAGWTPNVLTTSIVGPTTFTAQWNHNGYVISYNANGGTRAPANQLKTLGTPITLSATLPTRTGHTFQGWNSKADGTGTTYAAGSSYALDAPVFLFAQWKVNTYVIGYNVNGGTGTYTNHIKNYGENIVLSSAVPTKTGYSFSGWNTKLDGTGTNFSAGATFSLNLNTTLYAQWKIDTWTVRYNSNGGSGAPANQTKVWGTDLILDPMVPTKQGHTFTFWNTAANGSGSNYAAGGVYNVNSNVTLYAQFKINTWTVSYHANGGSAVPENQLKVWNSILELTAEKAVRTGYTFEAWNTKADGTGNSYNPGSTYYNDEDISLFAQWTINTWTIRFDANGGVGAPANQVKTFGIPLTLTNVKPTKVGHTFTAWNTAVNGSGDSYASGGQYTPETAGTLFAQWTPIKYPVTFDSAGGSAVASQNVDYNTLAAVPTPPTRNEYTFIGWSPAIASTPITEATTFIAQWKHNGYRIQYDANGGNGKPSDQTKTLGTPITLSTLSPSRVGHSFKNWNTKADGSGTAYTPGQSYTTEAAVTLYAQWNINTYTVSFDADGGSAVVAVTVKYNELTPPPTPPTKTGYTFREWLPNIAITRIIQNTTFKAVWDINYYEVVFDTDGGSAVEKQSIAYNTLATKPANPTKTGYGFMGWTPEMETTKITDNTTFKALWNPNKYAVTFDSNGGSAVTSQIVDYSQLATVPTVPTRTGYTFNGWSPAIADTPITKDTTFTAQWTINKYPVTFNSDGGSAVADQSVNYNTLATAPTNPTKTGYTFNGWSPAIASTPITKATTFTAQWIINKYAVTFDSNGGSAVASQSVNYNTLATVPTNPTRTGYTFNGWSPAIASTPITKDTLFVAQWTLDKYTVTFNTVGGSAVASQSVNYNTLATEPANPTRTGYTFNGWSPAIASTVIIQNTTFTAQWKINSYSLTINPNGGTFNGSTSTKVVANDYLNWSVFRKPVRTGYTFGGWTESGSGTVTPLGTNLPARTEATLAGNSYWMDKVSVYNNAANGTVTIVDTAGTNPYDNSGKFLRITSTGQDQRPGRGGFIFNTLSEANATYYHVFVANVPVGVLLSDARNAIGDGGSSTWLTSRYGTGKMETYVYRVDAGATGSFSTFGHVYAAEFSTTNLVWDVYYSHIFKNDFATMSSSEGFGFKHTGDKTVTAQWNPINYTVTYNANGGTGAPATQTFIFNSGAKLSTTVPTRTGYTFSHWSYSGNNFAPGAAIPDGWGSFDLVAQWTINKYTVTFNSNGGSAVASQTVNHGSTATTPTAPTRTNYTFTGWSPAIASTVINSATTFTAQWSLNTYAVTYNANGGSGAPAAQTKTSGTNLTLSSVLPTRAGYRFNGWNTNAAGTGTNYASGATYTSNAAVTLYAKWVLQQEYIFVLGGVGGSGSSNLYGFSTVIPFSVTAGSPYYMEGAGYVNQQAVNDGKSLAVFGYDSGWNWATSTRHYATTRTYAGSYFTPTLTGPMYVTAYLYPSGGSRTGTAVWEGSTLYQDTSYQQGKIWKNVDSGTVLTLPAATATKTGHSFGGWTNSVNSVTYAAGSTVAISSTTVFYAQWIPNSYTVSFNANGGSGAPANQTKTYGTNLALSSTNPSRSGYNFIGWSTSPTGGVVYQPGSTYGTDAPVTLYAQWSQWENKCAVSNTANGYYTQLCINQSAKNESAGTATLSYTFRLFNGSKTFRQFKTNANLIINGVTVWSVASPTQTASATTFNSSIVIKSGTVTVNEGTISSSSRFAHVNQTLAYRITAPLVLTHSITVK